MNRREFIGGSAARSLAARAKKRTMPVVGFLNVQSADDSKTVVA
jgi:hypothetical protein